MITYALPHLLWEVLLMFMGGSRSRRQTDADSRRPGFHRTLIELAGTDEAAAASPDTCYWLLRKLPPSELVVLIARLMRRLFRMRCLEPFRFGKEWLVAVDGTWLRRYDRPHCPQCLHQKQPDGTTVWFHAVLEAKLVLANGLTFSLASVPIENTGEEYDKQDCELTAFPRLAKMLKELYPRLPICILADSLYGCAPAIRICERMRWSYIIVFKEGRTPALWKRAVARQSRPVAVRRPGVPEQAFRWTTMIEHEGSTLHAVFCDETASDGTLSHWAWLTDHRPNRGNVSFIANKGGRRRENIEEAFNEQKNGEIRLKHDYGSSANAWYNYYLLAQVAHMILQIIRLTDLVRKLSDSACATFVSTFHTMRNFVIRLHESIQRDRIAARIRHGYAARIQVRFLDTS
jgi:hypothetical protein